VRLIEKFKVAAANDNKETADIFRARVRETVKKFKFMI
jgi:hypothetical protein